MEHVVFTEAPFTKVLAALRTSLHKAGLFFAPRCLSCGETPQVDGGYEDRCPRCSSEVAAVFSNGAVRTRRWVRLSENPVLVVVAPGKGSISVAASVDSVDPESAESGAYLRFLARAIEGTVREGTVPSGLVSRNAQLNAELEAEWRGRRRVDLEKMGFAGGILLLIVLTILGTT